MPSLQLRLRVAHCAMQFVSDESVSQVRQFLSDADIVYSSAGVESQSQTESMNSATGETIGSYTEATAAEAMQAVAATLKAFRDTDWWENRSFKAKVLKPPFAKWWK